MRLAFTPDAQASAGELDAWWRENRPGARALFARELAEARELLVNAPTIGSPYTTRSGKTVRRLLLPKTRHHLYFEVDEANRLIVILAIWGGPRGSEPRL
jgi:plasmid stabilization system protein ParE